MNNTENSDSLEPDSSGRRKQIFKYLRILVSALLLLYLLSFVEFDELKKMMASSNPYWLLLSVAGWGVSIFLLAVRWKLIMKPLKLDISLKRTFNIYLTGHFYNAILLGSAGGDVVMLYMATQSTKEGKLRAASSLLIDRAIGYLSLAVLAVIGIAVNYQTLYADKHIRIITHVALALCVVGVSALAALWLLKHFSSVYRSVIASRAGRLSRSINEILSTAVGLIGHRAFYYAIALSFFNHAIFFVIGFIIAKSMGIPVSIVDIAYIFPLVFLAMSLPISIAGHGVREAMFILLFNALLVSDGRLSASNVEETAITYSIFIYLNSLIWSIIGGIVYLINGYKVKV